MINSQLIIAILSGITVLIFLIVKLRINAFLSLLISCIVVGVISGMPAQKIIDSMSNGMGSTLSTVAVIIGLGAIFGAILEHSGGAKSLAVYLLKKTGEKKAPTALIFAGIIIAIPVFFDVAFIILLPIIQALSGKTKKPVLFFAIPLLTGLAIAHSFIPPTPGPVAVADIINAELGWVILFGLIVGTPTALICGVLLNKSFTKVSVGKVQRFVGIKETDTVLDKVLVKSTLYAIALPILLILLNTVTKALIEKGIIEETSLFNFIVFIGHPFVALSIATLVAMYFLGTKKGLSKDKLFEISNKSFAPAGSIILITGAGGMFKQVLIDTGSGQMIANALAESGIYLVPLSFTIAALVRILQGSTTVAMITAAGIVAPLLEYMEITSIDKALLVLSISSGALILSHVNDSGFWLVSRYLNLSVKETFRSWSLLTLAISIVSFVFIMLLNWIL